MKNRKKADTYRFNMGSIGSIEMADLVAFVKQFEAKLADPDDLDDKKWTARWLERFKKELDKKRTGRSLKQQEQEKQERHRTNQR